MDFLTNGLISLGGWLLQAILPTLATAGAALALRLLQQQLKKAGLDLTEKQAEAFRKLVENAIVAVEELARRRALSGDPMPPLEKRDAALGKILDARPDVSPEVAGEVLDQMLPKVRQILTATPIRQQNGGKAPPVPSTPGTFGRH